jgi:hypothetical protein
MDQRDIWKLVVGVLIGVGVILHAVLPRYEWRAIGDDGRVIVVYDRWSNFIQRAVYDDQGHIRPMDPYKPF